MAAPVGHEHDMETVPVALTLAHFTPLVGAVLGIADRPDVPFFMLVSANPLTKQANYPGAREPFVLTFHADTPDPQQGMRVFDVPGVGPTAIFLVPVAQVGDLIAYEAVFN